MATCLPPTQTVKNDVGNVALSSPDIEIALLTGGFDKPYAFGIAMALVGHGLNLDIIGSDDVDSPEMHTTPGLTFFNLLSGQRRDTKVLSTACRVLIYYARLLRYAAIAKPRIFHILWNNKFQLFDRTMLMLYYKCLGKKIVLTAHNVNAGKRDSNDSWLNRFTLKIQYRLADCIFVHTEKMKSELIQEFGVGERAVTVIPFGINNAVPDTDLTPRQAKQRLGVREDEKTILFFGNIGPYKGLEFLVAGFQQIVGKNQDYRLIIAGKLRGGCELYWDQIRETISQGIHGERVIQKIEYIPDEETELYFKAADVLVLPYTHVSQSGVLFLGYSFGVPVIVTDVGSFREDIIEGKTGFICRPRDSVDLAKAIRKYFESDLFKTLHRSRQEIKDHANARHSWNEVGEVTRKVYAQLLGEQP